MKKLLFFAFVALFLVACSPEKKPVDPPVVEPTVLTFNELLKPGQTEYQAVDEIPETGTTYDASFTDDEAIVSFAHSYTDWGYGDGYTFGKFTVTTDAAVCAVDVEKPFLYVYTSDFAVASFELTSEDYTLDGVWVANSEASYTDMTEGNAFGARAFKAGDKFTLTATGYDASGNQVGTASIDLANYTADTDKPASEWLWFDLTSLSGVRKVEFTLTSTDVGEYGMNTSSYFCMDRVTLQLNSNQNQKPAKAGFMVLEHRPAPGQFVKPTHDAVWAQAQLEKNAIVSLGGWGGYIVVKFDTPATSKIAIRGNAFENSSEPGIVYVMRDANGNGLPDDEWIELEGSEETTKNHSKTYPDGQTFTGSLLCSNVTGEGQMFLLTPYEWGYADNYGTDYSKNEVTLDVARSGLPEVDFVKIQTGVDAEAGWLGEISTEVCGVGVLS